MMKLVTSVRGITVLLVAPLLTFVVSLLAIIYLVVLRGSARKAQMLPRMWGKIILAISGVRVTVEGLENIEPDRPYIFAANHQSQFDIFAMQGCFHVDFRWLAKQELFRIPLFGKAMRLAGYVAVDRSHGREALKSLKEAAERIAAGTSVVLFPEGTRSRDGRLQPFKTGGMVLAIKSGVPLVPVGISGTFQVLPKGRLLAQPGRVVIRVGRPLETRGLTAGQKQELAERLHGEVARLLGQG
ncbi:MAG: lysophospholipid acyltransferase family protein [Thermodesulfobacteriota bacterium]